MAAPRGLRRVAALYALVERVRAGELRVASAAVIEAEEMVRLVEGGRCADHQEARAGLERGSAVALFALEAVRELQERERTRAMGLVKEREVACERALTAHRESRTDLEQLRRLLSREDEAFRLVRERSEQAQSDDRFLAMRKRPDDKVRIG